MPPDSHQKPRVLVITGPTASGKSRLALEIGQTQPVEIISADSAQVYVGLDIGTAKPDTAERASVPHHLIDVRDPANPYSAAVFREDVERLVSEISDRGNIALIVGGTMLYLKALRDGLADLPEADPIIREEIKQFAEDKGWPAVHAELAAVDPDAALRIKPADPQRLQRALEVYRITGESMTSLHKKGMVPCSFEMTEIAIMPPDRLMLHQLIAARFREMLAAGFIDEVAALKARNDLDESLPAIRSVGYRQIWSYLAGNIDETQMTEQAVAATRQLAKRQYTWLRGWREQSRGNFHVLEAPDLEKTLKIGRAASILA